MSNAEKSHDERLKQVLHEHLARLLDTITVVSVEVDDDDVAWDKSAVHIIVFYEKKSSEPCIVGLVRKIRPILETECGETRFPVFSFVSIEEREEYLAGP